MRSLHGYTLDSIFDFGKFYGYSVRRVLEMNFNYVFWCIQHVDWFSLTESSFDQLSTLFCNPYNQEDTYFKAVKRDNLNKCWILDARRTVVQDSYEDDWQRYSDEWLVDAAGTDDPEMMNDVYWNLD